LTTKDNVTRVVKERQAYMLECWQKEFFFKFNKIQWKCETWKR